jgi:hypothetical protein
MATLQVVVPLSMGALTQRQIISRSEISSATSAALTEPREQESLVVQCTEIAGTSCMPSWVEATVRSFVEIARLSENWDSYGGRAIERDLIVNALETLAVVMRDNFPAPSVVPLSDGGLQIEWHRKQKDLELVFSPDEEPYFFYYDKAAGKEDEGSIRQPEKLVKLIKGLV